MINEKKLVSALRAGADRKRFSYSNPDTGRIVSAVLYALARALEEASVEEPRPISAAQEHMRQRFMDY
jgi:hypothetical protein